jgi:hypothetical protein
MAKKIVILIFCFIFLTPPLCTAQAGFGISPPYIKSQILRPGTIYERRINLLRSSAEEDLEARIIIEAPDIQSWITVDKGLSFILPKNKLSVPMVVKVAVPSGASLGNYRGQINIKVAKVNDWASGVAVSLGALVDINLTVTNEIFSDYKIRQVKIPDFEAPGQPWNSGFFSWFFRRLRVIVRIENTGNVEIAPSKIALDLYGIPAKDLLESLVNTRLEKIKPYETREITASFPAKLGVGQYWGKVKIYKGNDVLYTEQITFAIAAPGTLKGNFSGIENLIWIFSGIICAFGVIFIFIFFKKKTGRSFFALSDKQIRLLQSIKAKNKLFWFRAKRKYWLWVKSKSINVISKSNKSGRKRHNDK